MGIFFSPAKYVKPSICFHRNVFQKCSQLVKLEAFFFLIKKCQQRSSQASENCRRQNNLNYETLPHHSCNDFYISSTTSWNTPKDLPGFYFPFEAVNIRLNEFYAEFHVPFPIHRNREGHPCLEMSRILGHNPLAICCSALGWTLQDKKAAFAKKF